MIFKHFLTMSFGLAFVFSSQLHAEGDEGIKIPGIGSKAPSFQADTTKGYISFPEDYAGKWVILFSHPADFTPVCATEFMRFARMVPRLEHFNTKIIGLSTDSTYIHNLWIGNLEKTMGRHRKINFPVIADTKKKIAEKYGMIHPHASKHETVRSIHIIDPNGIIRAILYYPITNGRNFQEVERLLRALQETDKYNVVTPAEWQPGDETIKPPKKEDVQKTIAASAQAKGPQ